MQVKHITYLKTTNLEERATSFLLSRHVNVGHDFQAELPPCSVDDKGSGVWSPEEKSPREQLLWKPWDNLEDSANLQDQGKRHARTQPRTFWTFCPALTNNCTENASSSTLQVTDKLKGQSYSDLKKVNQKL